MEQLAQTEGRQAELVAELQLAAEEQTRRGQEASELAAIASQLEEQVAGQEAALAACQEKEKLVEAQLDISDDRARKADLGLAAVKKTLAAIETPSR